MAIHTIFIVDDDLLCRTLLKRLLFEKNFLVFSQINGRDAWHQLVYGGIMPSAIITDKEMPVMNGLEFAQKLSRSMFKQIPLIFCTSSKVDGYPLISKPITLDGLNAALAEVGL